MKITLENFEEAYAESLRRLDAYRETQVTKDQQLQVDHQKLYVTSNRPYFMGCLSKGEYVALCKNCGAVHATNYIKNVKERMEKHGLCFNCAYWMEQIEKFKPSWLIINGHIYSDAGNRPGADSNRESLGFAGHVWKIERDGVVWETNNLWSGSTIPQEHRAALPDNAKFVK